MLGFSQSVPEFGGNLAAFCSTLLPLIWLTQLSQGAKKLKIGLHSAKFEAGKENLAEAPQNPSKPRPLLTSGLQQRVI